MDKKKICKLNPGVWILVEWEDADPELALLLEKPERKNGDVSLFCYYPEREICDDHAVHTQVKAIIESLVVPDLFDYPDIFDDYC